MADLGNYLMVNATLGAHRVNVKLPEDVDVPEGEAHLVLQPAQTRLYADQRLVG